MIDYYNLPIAIRKGVKKCTQQPAYPLSHFVSHEKLSSGHKSFLNQLNTIIIPKAISKPLKIKEWKENMKVEMDTLVEEQNMGCKRVFIIKHKANGSLEWYKARLVAKEYTQTQRIVF